MLTLYGYDTAKETAFKTIRIIYMCV